MIGEGITFNPNPVCGAAHACGLARQGIQQWKFREEFGTGKLMLGPIFNREWLTLPRRPRHYLLRTLSLGALWVLAFTVWQTTVGWEDPAGINDLSRFGLLLFQIFAYVQLVLLLFFSALSAAGTISQEKDRRTFVLLLMTDLRNYEIVLGKLFGSLLRNPPLPRGHGADPVPDRAAGRRGAGSGAGGRRWCWP